jgi:hypothetical protein
MRPKQLLWAAALRMKRELVEEEPEIRDDDQSHPKELAEDANLHCPQHIFPGALFMITRVGEHEVGAVVGSDSFDSMVAWD